MFLSLSESTDGEARRFHGIIRDETAEMEQRELMEAIVDSCLDPIVAIDHQGTIVRCNDAALKVFRYEALAGQNVRVLVPEPHRSQHDAYIARYLRSGVGGVMGKGRELEGQRSDGETFPMHLSLSEARVGGQQVFTGIIRDLSVGE